MNLFSKRNLNHLEKEEKFIAIDQFSVIAGSEPEEEQEYSVTEIKRKDLYYPNPALFRRLIEGTSLDRRKKVDHSEEEMMDTGAERTEIVLPKKSTQMKGISISSKSDKHEIPVISGNKKKFINKVRRSRLGHVVHEVLGYPEKQLHSKTD